MEFSEEFGISKKNAKEMLSWVENKVMQGVRDGDEVVLDIGKFHIKKVPARTARNPITGASIKVPAKTKPVFKASKKFRDGVA
jgi:nucleoid DNA-binding protein